jgi:hypothetical protein
VYLSKFLVFYCFSCYIFLMSVTQTVEIPVSHRLIIDVPPEVPTGSVILTFTPASAVKERISEELEIEDVRRLLQKEMAEKGTSKVKAASGDGWEAHVMEHYAEP